MTTQDLLEKWREATRAAQLAKRLAELAAAAVEQADASALSTEEIAQMAERVAREADQAAASARKAADRAAAYASDTRSNRLREADESAKATADDETDARDAYHRAEGEARARHAGD